MTIEGENVINIRLDEVKTMKYINLTPTWEGILPALLAVVTNGETVEARKTAEDELRRMARLADAYVEGVHGARLDDDFDPADAQRKGF